MDNNLAQHEHLNNKLNKYVIGMIKFKLKQTTT